MMRIITVLNQESCHPARFGELLEERGVTPTRVNAWLDPPAEELLDDADGVIVLGGSMGAHDEADHPHLTNVLALLRAAHERGTPVLGICLGSQLLAKALGAKTYPRTASEIGWFEIEVECDDPLLGPAGTRTQLDWHLDSFDVPPAARRLARGRGCTNQAFRTGNSYGLQFHPELDEATMAAWVRAESSRADLDELGVDPQTLFDGLERHRAEYVTQARRIVQGFIDLVDRERLARATAGA
jgi:GMP synthase (glutamine-hydrolysing)